MSNEELKQQLVDMIEELYKTSEEITKAGKNFGVEQYFGEELTQHLNVSAIEGKYSQSTELSRVWKCDQGYNMPIIKEFRVRKRAGK